jgi:hypothetical protein
MSRAADVAGVGAATDAELRSRHLSRQRGRKCHSCPLWVVFLAIAGRLGQRAQREGLRPELPPPAGKTPSG